MGRRLQPRVKGILPVRISGSDREGKNFAEHVCTVDISNKGVMLAGVRAPLAVGDNLTLQFRNRQAQFRVAWLAESEVGSGKQIGLECLQPEKELWPVAVPKQGPDSFIESGLPEDPSSAVEGRRTHSRFPVNGKAYVMKKDGAGRWAELGDISMTGCYLHTADPFEVGKSVSLRVKVAHCEFKATATVRSSHLATGMGLEFTFLSNTDRGALQRLIEHLKDFDTVAH